MEYSIYLLQIFVADIRRNCVYLHPKELFDRNALHIAEFMTIAKSLPRFREKCASRLFLNRSYFIAEF